MASAIVYDIGTLLTFFDSINKFAKNCQLNLSASGVNVYSYCANQMGDEDILVLKDDYDQRQSLSSYTTLSSVYDYSTARLSIFSDSIKLSSQIDDLSKIYIRNLDTFIQSLSMVIDLDEKDQVGLEMMTGMVSSVIPTGEITVSSLMYNGKNGKFKISCGFDYTEVYENSKSEQQLQEQKQEKQEFNQAAIQAKAKLDEYKSQIGTSISQQQYDALEAEYNETYGNGLGEENIFIFNNPSAFISTQILSSTLKSIKQNPVFQFNIVPEYMEMLQNKCGSLIDFDYETLDIYPQTEMCTMKIKIQNGQLDRKVAIENQQTQNIEYITVRITKQQYQSEYGEGTYDNLINKIEMPITTGYICSGQIQEYNQENPIQIHGSMIDKLNLFKKQNAEELPCIYAELSGADACNVFYLEQSQQSEPQDLTGEVYTISAKILIKSGKSTISDYEYGIMYDPLIQL